MNFYPRGRAEAKLGGSELSHKVRRKAMAKLIGIRMYIILRSSGKMVQIVYFITKVHTSITIRKYSIKLHQMVRCYTNYYGKEPKIIQH